MKQLLYPAFVFFFFVTFSLTAQQATPPNVPTPSFPEINFPTPSFDYGMIEAGEKVVHTYPFTNTGTVPLVLSNAKGSCGCTVPEWPKEPILPGESAEIVVMFNSVNKKGTQNKRVTITANTEPAQTFLTIKGEVLVPEEDDKTEEAVIAAERTQEENAEMGLLIDSYVVYPNPTSDRIQVKLKEVIGNRLRLIIYDELGRVMEERQEESVSLTPMPFDVSTYPAGAYRVVVQVDERMMEAKGFFVVRE